MDTSHSPATARKLFISIVITGLLLSGLYLEEVPAARAQEIPPVTPTARPEKTPPPGYQALSSDLAIAATADAYEPDNSAVELDGNISDLPIESGTPQNHSISPATDEDWVTFDLPTPASVTLETSGTTFSDTEIWLYALFGSDLVQVDYNDDKNPNTWYSYIQRCGAKALPAGTYYVKIDEYQGDNEIPSYNIAFNINAGCVPNATVNIGGKVKGNYWILQGSAAAQEL